MRDQVNLLMVTHNYPRFEGDFAGVFISLLAERLPDLGIRPVILAPHAPGAAEYEEKNGVVVYRFRYGPDEEENLAYRGNMHKLVLGSVSGIFRFKNFLDEFRRAADVVIEKENIHALAGHWLVPSGMVMKTVNRGKGLPTFMYSHGTDVRLAQKYFQVVYRYMKDFCLELRRWTVVSSYLKDAMVAMDGRLSEIIEVLPVPHNENVFYRDKDIAREENLIVAVTRFTGQKRVDYLIRAFALVAQKRPGTRLELYGGGAGRSEIEGLINRLGLNGSVTVHDPVAQEQLRGVYNRATVVVLNSVQEGFGLALSEAMLCGTAVVGARSGGITDIIEHERRGLLVEPDNEERLAEALLTVLTDSALRGRLAEAGHDFARNTYASSSLAEKYASIVKQGMARS